MPKLFTRLTRLATLCTVMAAAAAPAAFAQQTSAAPAAAAQNLNAPLFNGVSPLFSAKSLLTPNLADEVGYSSSSDATAGMDELAKAENFFNFDNGMQPAPRRRYRRPNYSDKMHNADGSNKLAFEAGAGFQVPVGNDTSNYLSTSYRFQVGAGYNLNKKVGVLLQFDYDHFRIPTNVLNSQQALYDSAGYEIQDPTTGNNVPVEYLSGNAHVWSFTLNPTYNFYTGDTWGAYAVVGGGFYHRVTTFTVPQTGVGYDYYYGYYQYTANATFDDYTSNSAGVNGGLGMTWKPGRFSNERIFAEVRLVHTFNEYRPGITTNAAAAANPLATNFFPANSLSANYIPVTFGVRF